MWLTWKSYWTLPIKRNAFTLLPNKVLHIITKTFKNVTIKTIVNLELDANEFSFYAGCLHNGNSRKGQTYCKESNPKTILLDKITFEKVEKYFCAKRATGLS